MGLMGSFITMYLKILLVMLSVVLLHSILSIGLINLTKKLGIKTPGLCWIPGLNLIILIKSVLGRKGLYTFLLISMISIGIMLTDYISIEYAFILIIINALITVISIHLLYYSFSEKAVLLTIFSILSGGLLVPLFIYKIKKKEKIEQTNKKEKPIDLTIETLTEDFCI